MRPDSTTPSVRGVWTVPARRPPYGTSTTVRVPEKPMMNTRTAITSVAGAKPTVAHVT